jgi:hypothetical protein
MSVTAKQVVIKQPLEVLNLEMDFTNLLDTGETISSPTVTTTPTGLTISSVAVDSTSKKVEMVASGGTDGVTYRVDVVVTTNASQTLEGDGILKVRSR